MLKKLQSLLFEEEIDDDEDEEFNDTGKQPVVVQNVQTQPLPQETPQQVVNELPVAEPVEKPVALEQEVKEVVTPPAPVMEEDVKEVKPTMQRIDVTQPIPTVASEPHQAPQQQSVFKEADTPAPRPVTTLGITADVTAEPKATKPASRPATKPQRRQDRPQQSSSYQFQPVISPIFGVDEKDLQALKTTTNKTSYSSKRSDENVTPIISPMYGKNEDDVPSSIQKTVEDSNYQEQFRVTYDKIAAEDDIPEFSLDDILNQRDDEFVNELPVDPIEKPASENTDTLFPDLNLWSEELEETDDATVVLERPQQ